MRARIRKSGLTGALFCVALLGMGHPFSPAEMLLQPGRPGAINLSRCEVITKDNANRMDEVLTLLDGEKPFDLAWSPDGRQLAVAWLGSVGLYDLENLRQPDFFAGPDLRWWVTLAYSPDGSILAASNGLNTIQLIDVEASHTFSILSTGDISPLALAFSPDGNTLAVGDFDGAIWLWDMGSRSVRTVLHPEKMRFSDIGRPISELEYNPDGILLASAPLSLWEVETLTELDLPLNLPRDILMAWDARDIAFSPDGQLLAAVHVNSKTQDVWFWDNAHQEKLASRIYDAELTSLAFSPDGMLLAVGLYRGAIYIDHIDDVFGEIVFRLPLNDTKVVSHDKKVDTLAFSPDGKLLASASSVAHTVKVWGICEMTDLNPFSAGMGIPSGHQAILR